MGGVGKRRQVEGRKRAPACMCTDLSNKPCLVSACVCARVQGYTGKALREAAGRGDAEKIRRMISAGVNVDARDGVPSFCPRACVRAHTCRRTNTYAL